MRRIPTAEQKEELKRLLKQQYEDTVASIDRDEGLDPAYADWSLSDEIEKTRKQIFEEVHIGKRSCGWKFLFAPNPQHYEETKESILKFIHRDGWLLFYASGTLCLWRYSGANPISLFISRNPHLWRSEGQQG